MVALLFPLLLMILSPKPPLDLSKKEDPFPSITMPPKAVYGGGYMDGGSVMVLIIDHLGAKHELTFPINYDGIIDAYPTAFSGNINDPGMVALKNPKRAKEIAIYLLDEFGQEMSQPSVDSNDSTARARRALASRPDSMVIRAFEKMKRHLERPLEH